MILRFTNYLMIAIFALAAIVQYNDVNAIRWMLVYGAAFIISLRYAMGKMHWATATALAGVCIIWALFKIPDLTTEGFFHMMDEVRMIQTGVEAAREFLGLLFIAGWMTTLTFVTRREKKSG
jgi:hypothetical protein